MAGQTIQAKSNVPIRICGSRSRSGCATCKKRHVKCDENRPICHTCQRARRLCIYELSPSYAPRPESSTDQKRIPAIPAAWEVYAFATKLGPSCNLSPYGTHEISEISALKNFTACIGKELSGHFADHVWCHIVPQVAQHEPSIWHAIVAINILNSSIRRGQKDQGNASTPQTAIQQYSKAIQELNVVIASGERARCQDVVLLSCVLFAIFECLQSHYRSTLRHIAGGLKLLAEWRNNTNSNDRPHSPRYFDHAMVQPIFLSLDSQAVQLGAVVFREHLLHQAVFDELNIPTSFSSIQEAHISLIHLFNRISHWDIWIQPEVNSDDKPEAEWMTSEEEKIRDQLAAWDSAFRILPSYVEPAILLLLLQRTMIQVLWNKDTIRSNEMGWDQHNALFLEAVEYAEAYVEMTTFECQKDSAQGRRSILTMTEDIVLPLYCISAKCRHSGIRRRALKMLKACNRKEGVWDSNDCALIAEKMIAFEERNALEDGTIEESSRIYTIDFDFEDENIQNISHKKLVLEGVDSYRTESFEEPSTIQRPLTTWP